MVGWASDLKVDPYDPEAIAEGFLQIAVDNSDGGGLLGTGNSIGADLLCQILVLLLVPTIRCAGEPQDCKDHQRDKGNQRHLAPSAFADIGLTDPIHIHRITTNPIPVPTRYTTAPADRLQKYISLPVSLPS